MSFVLRPGSLSCLQRTQTHAANTMTVIVDVGVGFGTKRRRWVTAKDMPLISSDVLST